MSCSSSSSSSTPSTVPGHSYAVSESCAPWLSMHKHRYQHWHGPDAVLVWARCSIGVGQIQHWCGPDAGLVWARRSIGMGQMQWTQ
jgi:hypothetical protein